MTRVLELTAVALALLFVLVLFGQPRPYRDFPGDLRGESSYAKEYRLAPRHNTP